ncbi:hypothetical protein DFH06DRAFT_1250555 [Mycena polygramma]|nr:hypothetical protein DFH06DRAFT_1250555 [Mycena polygramma]
MSALLDGSPSVSTPRFTDEIILEILEHLDDEELLSLAPVSKHIHDLALLSCLSRYGITETDIAANAFPPLSTSGAFPAFRAARFITSVDKLRLKFDVGAKLDQDVLALASLARRLPIKSMDLDFAVRLTPRAVRAVRQCDMEGLIFTLISEHRSRPTVNISPFAVSIIRPHKPRFPLLRRLRGRPQIKEAQFREELYILPLMRMGGAIPSISIRKFDVPDVLGTMLIFRASAISDLRFPPNLKLSAAEMTAIFEYLTLPLLRGVEAGLSGISGASLHGFLCRHRTLERLVLRGPSDPKSKSKGVHSCDWGQQKVFPADVLPKLEHVLGSAPLIGWILASPSPFPLLTVVTIELHKGASTPAAYARALQGIARRPAIDTLSLQVYGWFPWDEKHFDARAAEAVAFERNASHIVDLRLTFKMQYGGSVAKTPLLAKWLRLFTGVRKLALVETVPMKGLAPFLQQECPHIECTAYHLKK